MQSWVNREYTRGLSMHPVLRISVVEVCLTRKREGGAGSLRLCILLSCKGCDLGWPAPLAPLSGFKRVEPCCSSSKLLFTCRCALVQGLYQGIGSLLCRRGFWNPKDSLLPFSSHTAGVGCWSQWAATGPGSHFCHMAETVGPNSGVVPWEAVV